MTNQTIQTGVEHIRSLASQIPWWHTNTVDGRDMLFGDEGTGVLAEFGDTWKIGPRRFFNAVNRSTLLSLLHLLHLLHLLEECSWPATPRHIRRRRRRSPGTSTSRTSTGHFGRGWGSGRLCRS